MIREYLTTNKTTLARAYGFQREETLVSRIRDRLSRLDDDKLLQLGEWTGNITLLPDQVEIIVFMLGTPSEPDMVYRTKKTP